MIPEQRMTRQALSQAEAGDGGADRNAGDKALMTADQIKNVEQIQQLETMYGQNAMDGAELRELVQGRFGQLYDTRICHRTDDVGKMSMYLQVKWKYLGEDSFPLSEDEYNVQLNAVAQLVTEWGCAEQVRKDVLGCGKTPSDADADNKQALMIKLDVEPETIPFHQTSQGFPYDPNFRSRTWSLASGKGFSNVLTKEPRSTENSDAARKQEALPAPAAKYEMTYHESTQRFPGLNFAPIKKEEVKPPTPQVTYHEAAQRFPALNIAPTVSYTSPSKDQSPSDPKQIPTRSLRTRGQEAPVVSPYSYSSMQHHGERPATCLVELYTSGDAQSRYSNPVAGLNEQR
jgi:hypothetical protein